MREPSSGGTSAASPGADVPAVGPDRAQMWQRVRAAAPMPARVRARGMLWHGTVGSACVTPAHVRPETRKRRAINACDMLPPLISGSIVQRKHRATQATCDNVCHTAQRRACGLQTGPPTLTPTHSAPCRAAAQPGVTRRGMLRHGVLRALSPARACRRPPPVTPPSPAHTKRKRRAEGACVWVCVCVSLCAAPARHRTTPRRPAHV